jgi:hypothetical protein
VTGQKDTGADKKNQEGSAPIAIIPVKNNDFEYITPFLFLAHGLP